MRRPVRLCLVASKPTDSVIFGFLPAAARLGLDVVLITDKPDEHGRARARASRLPRPGCAPQDAGSPAAETALPKTALPNTAPASAGPVRMVRCDVGDIRQLIAAIAALPAQDAIFSNSDHLQVQAALAAEYFGLPGKDWRSAMRAKNKPLMRRRLAETGIERVATAELRPGASHPPRGLSYPVVLKPAEGVASEDVMLVRSAAELAERSAQVMGRRPGETLVAEEYLPGGLRTLETLGDGRTTWVLGGFRTRLSPLPFFIEERLTWDGPAPEAAREHVLGALTALGATFGACHTEYADGDRGPALIEVNDRMIGDHGDFLLADLLGVDLFELVLRVHLGEPLPPGPPPSPGGDSAHAIIDYVVADRAGVLAAAPPAQGRRHADLGVTLTYRPLREVGERIELTHTNRDYLGEICAIGADPAAVDLSVAAMRATGNWEITEARP